MENYKISINVKEGNFEINGDDPQWVSTNASETLKMLGEIYKTMNNYTTVETVSIDSEKKQSSGRKGVAHKANRLYKGPAKNENLENLLNDNNLNLITAYINERKDAFDKKGPNQAAIIAMALREILKLENVDQNDLYTIYSRLGLKSPTNIIAQLKNATKRDNYFYLLDKKYTLTVVGENFAKIDSKKQ